MGDILGGKLPSREQPKLVPLVGVFKFQIMLKLIIAFKNPIFIQKKVARGSNFFREALFFSNIAHTSANTTTAILRFSDAPLSRYSFEENWGSAVLWQEVPVMLSVSKRRTPLNYDKVVRMSFSKIFVRRNPTNSSTFLR